MSLSAYEQERRANILRNNAKLRELGLADDMDAVVKEKPNSGQPTCLAKQDRIPQPRRRTPRAVTQVDYFANHADDGCSDDGAHPSDEKDPDFVEEGYDSEEIADAIERKFSRAPSTRAAVEWRSPAEYDTAEEVGKREIVDGKLYVL